MASWCEKAREASTLEASEGPELTSELLPERLVTLGKPSVQVHDLRTGATVVQLELHPGRLHYRLLQGTGPETGWVTVEANGKELMAVGAPKEAPKEAPIRILALAGSATCHEMIRFQCGPLAAALGKAGQGLRSESLWSEEVQWSYWEGTEVHPSSWFQHLSDLERTVAKRRLARMGFWERKFKHSRHSAPSRAVFPRF